jgi:hypothetical protein
LRRHFSKSHLPILQKSYGTHASKKNAIFTETLTHITPLQFTLQSRPIQISEREIDEKLNPWKLFLSRVNVGLKKSVPGKDPSGNFSRCINNWSKDPGAPNLPEHPSRQAVTTPYPQWQVVTHDTLYSLYIGIVWKVVSPIMQNRVHLQWKDIECDAKSQQIGRLKRT